MREGVVRMATKLHDSGADQGAPASLFPNRFQVQEITANLNVGATRDPEGVLVFPSGRALFNTGGTELCLNLMYGANFAEPSKCGFIWGFDAITGEIAGKIVSPQVKGVTAVRYNEKQDQITAYLNGLFMSNPAAAPTSKRWVPASRWSDPELGDFLVLHMNLALTKSKLNRSAKSQAKKTETTNQKPENAPAPTGTAKSETNPVA
jgi:hypothetical protein